VLDAHFLAGQTALLVPRTPDGRVLFAIPWHGRTVVGTTDTALEAPTLEPRATEDEVSFILETAAGYLARAPRREDVRAVFAGIRPLVQAAGAESTAALSRDHTLLVSSSGMITLTGGKWTTYRNMAEDCVNRAAEVAGLASRTCVTQRLPVHGAMKAADLADPRSVYGSDRGRLEDLQRAEPRLAGPVHPGLTASGVEVAWAVDVEMARTVEDVLARRTRALLLDADAAVAAAPAVARIMAERLGRDQNWARDQVADFRRMARAYQYRPEAA
ncbi:MAG: glycerol-3-phosphate dehydrogenase C-terminal domain-containing protein, partial [Myxococcota bacterium]